MNEDTGGRHQPGQLAAVLARAALLAGATLLAVGCGGGSSSAPPRASNGLPSAAMLDSFAACMRGHGVLNFYFSNSPNTSNTSNELSIFGHYVPGVNPQTAQFGAAMKACKHLLPGGGPSPMTQKQIDSLVKFAACMRSHGYPDYPDPVVQNGRVAEKPLPSSIDTNSAQFQAAEKTCNTSS